ncbi:MAG: GGDEF domain-containing protein [Candidatus Thiodiazotropha taylori]
MKRLSLAKASAYNSVDGEGGSLISELKFLLFPSPDFLQSKYLDHRTFTIIITAVLSLLWASLWWWDYVTDPIGAENTIGLRLLYLSALPLSVALLFIKRTSGGLAVIFVTGMLAAEMNFILILNFLDSGEVFGRAGVMYCMVIAVLTLQSFSLRVNVAYTILACLLPHLSSLLNIMQEFHHDHYAALIWPAAALAILAQTVQSHHYLLRYRLQQKLQASAITDPLTGAKNRRYFMPMLDREIAKANRQPGRLSVLMLDIDHFKQVNDNYGHPTGDRVICNLSTVCHQFARNMDVVPRFGGEECAILLTECNAIQAAQVAERIRAEIADQTLVSEDGIAFSYKVSIGVAEFQKSDANSMALISRVDRALYAAKQGGRNCVVVAEAPEASGASVIGMT